MRNDLDRYVEEFVQYLTARSTTATNRFDSSAAESAIRRLEIIQGHLAKAEKQAITLMERDLSGRLETAGGAGLPDMVRKAFDGIIDARVAVSLARQEIYAHRNDGRTKASLRRDRLSAVRLAWAVCGPSRPRDTRSLSIKIMRKAGIPEPSSSSLTTLIKEAKSE